MYGLFSFFFFFFTCRRTLSTYYHVRLSVRDVHIEIPDLGNLKVEQSTIYCTKYNDSYAPDEFSKEEGEFGQKQRDEEQSYRSTTGISVVWEYVVRPNRTAESQGQEA